VKIWRVGDSQELLTLHSQGDGISAVGITSDSRRIILAPWRGEGEGGELEIWDSEIGEMLQILTGHTDLVFEIKMIGESQRFLSAALDGTVRVWDLTTGMELYTIEAQVSPFFDGIKLSPEGSRAILDAYDPDLGEVEFQVWDLSRGEKLATLATDSAQVIVGGEETVDVKIDPTWALPINEETVIGTMSDFSFVVWDLETGEMLRKDEYAAPDALATTRDGRQAVVANGNILEIWDLESWNVLSTLDSAHTGPVTCMIVMPGGRSLLTGSEDGTIREWDIETGKELNKLESGYGIGPPINAIAISPDGGNLVAVAEWSIKIWDPQSRKEIMTIERIDRDITSVEITPDGERFITGSSAGVVSIFNLGTGREEKSFAGFPGVSDFTVLPDGKRLVVASGTSASFYDLETGELLSQVQGQVPNGSVEVTSGGMISNDGTKMAYATFDLVTEEGMIHIVDLTTGNEVLTLAGHKDRITSLALFPDGRKLLSGSWDNTVRLWDLETGEELFLRAEEWADAKVIVITSDSQRALILSHLDVVKVWDLSSWVDDVTVD
jgi:WD40 repeat protein